MQTLTNLAGVGGDANGARIADWLWMQAGRPSGRYMEFWLNVEDAIEKLQRSKKAPRTAPLQTRALKQAMAAVHSERVKPGLAVHLCPLPDGSTDTTDENNSKIEKQIANPKKSDACARSSPESRVLAEPTPGSGC